MILPIVKHQTEAGGTCLVSEKITYSFENDIGRIGAAAFADFVCGAEQTASDSFVEFYVDDSLEDRDEIYRVSVLADKIKIGFRDARGAVNGAATVALLLRKKELNCCEIVDYPDASYRSFLMDMSRGVPTEDDIFSTIRSMALAKYNKLHLHIIDSYGPCYVSDAVPEFKFENKGEPCTKDLLRRIIDVCDMYAIEIIPELEIPAHAWALTNAHPEFKCTAEGALGWVVCPGNDDIWPFFEKLTAELVELFPKSEYIHIGTDELEFGDLGSHYHCYWDRCPRCAALRKREGLADIREEFYYVVKRMHEIVKSHGKKMMMYNDQIDVSKDVPLSRDILIHFWRIASAKRGPVEGCSMKKFVEKGFHLINSHFPYAYTDRHHYITPEKTKTWTYMTSDEQIKLDTDLILGGECCGWMMGDYVEYRFLGYVIPPVLALFGDKLWDTSDREHTEDFRKALSEYLFGNDEYTCIFDAVGSLFPPRRTNTFIDLDAQMPPRELVADCLAKLKLVSNKNCLVTAEKYIELFEKITKQLDEEPAQAN